LAGVTGDGVAPVDIIPLLVNTTGTLNIRNQGSVDVTGAILVGKDGTISAGPGDADLFATVVNNATVHVPTGDVLTFYNDVTGSGDFTGPGNVVFAGKFAGGSSTAVIEFEGDVVFTDTGTLEAELDARSEDQLNVLGDVALAVDHTLTIKPIGFLGGPGSAEWGDQSRTIIRGSISGTFTNSAELDHLGYGVFLTDQGQNGQEVTCSTDFVVVDLLQAVPGDCDGDLDVDSFDIQLVLAELEARCLDSSWLSIGWL